MNLGGIPEQLAETLLIPWAVGKNMGIEDRVLEAGWRATDISMMRVCI